MSNRCILPLGLMVVLSMTVGVVQAGAIVVPNASFESPVLNLPTPYTTTFAQLLPWIGNWSAYYRPDLYAPLFGEGGITPEDGLNVGYINNTSEVFRPWLYQTLNYAYLEGADYTLSMAAAEYKDGEGADGQQLTLRLGYWTGTPDPSTGPVVVAERVIEYSELSVGAFADFTVNTGPISGDAVGKQIVVYISRADTSAVGGRWVIDNVQLGSVPDTPPIPPIPPVTNPVASGAIILDGDVSEWTTLGVTPFDPDPNDNAAASPDWAQLWMAHDDTYIYFRMDRWTGSLEFESPDAWGYLIELDTDQNPTTGDGGSCAVGPDFVTRGGIDAARWQRDGIPCGYTLLPTTYGLQPGSLSMEFAIPRADLGDPAAISLVGYGYPGSEFYPNDGATTKYFTYVIHEPGATEPAVVASLSNPVLGGAIAVDGNAGDWTGISGYPTDAAGDGGTAQDWIKATIAHDADNVYFLIERTPESAGFDSTGYWIVLDTDVNKATGLSGSEARNFSIGGEHSISGSLAVSAWAANGCFDHDATASMMVEISPDGTIMEASIPRMELGLLEPLSEFRVIFVGQNSGDFYPEGSYANNGGTTFLYQLASCGTPFADADKDSDVDQDDFGAFQRCYSGLGGHLGLGCECFDRDNNGGAGDGDIDVDDLMKFMDCFSGPTVAPDSACGQ